MCGQHLGQCIEVRDGYLCVVARQSHNITMSACLHPDSQCAKWIEVDKILGGVVADINHVAPATAFCLTNTLETMSGRLRMVNTKTMRDKDSSKLRKQAQCVDLVLLYDFVPVGDEIKWHSPAKLIKHNPGRGEQFETRTMMPINLHATGHSSLRPVAM